MRMRIRQGVRMGLFSIPFWIGLVYAQEEIVPVFRTPYVMAGGRFQSWRIQHQRNPISQISAPLTLILPIGDRLQFQVSNTPAVSWLYEGMSLNGPSDTWVQGSLLLGDNLAVINVGGGIPTGKTRLNNEAFQIATLLGRNIFAFGLPVHGEGLTLKVGGIIAKGLSDAVVAGIGAQYVRKGAYRPVDYQIRYTVGSQTFTQRFSPEYRPGDELTGQFGVDVLIHPDLKLMCDAEVTRYDPDLLDGEKIYGAGWKLLLKGMAYYRYEDKHMRGQILYRHRGKNEVLQGTRLVPETLRSTGYQAELDYYVEYASVENAKLYALVDGRFYGKNDYGRQSANVMGFGLGVIFQSVAGPRFDFRIKYLAGNWDHKLVEGMDIFLGLSTEL